MKKIYIIYVLILIDTLNTLGQGKGGLILDNPQEYSEIPKANLPVGADLSPIRKKDLSDFFPKIGDQQSQNSCVGWALCYYMKTFYEKSIKGADISHNEHIYSPSFLYNSLISSHDKDCSSGVKISKALKFLKDNGAVPISLFPIGHCGVKPDNTIRNKAKEFKILDYARVPDVNNLNYIKLFLNSHFPVIVGANINNKFKNLKKNEVHTDFSSPIDSHALIVVGYDETTPVKKFKVVNSYGDKWGDEGFGWIEYEAFRNMVDQAWIAFPDDREIDAHSDIIDNFTVLAEENIITSGHSFYRYWIELENDILFKDLKTVIYRYNDPLFAVKADTINTKFNNFSGKYIGSKCTESITAFLIFENSISKEVTFNLCDVIKRTSNENNLVGSAKEKNYDFTPIVTVKYKKKLAGKKWYDFKIVPSGINQFKDKIIKFEYEYNHPTLKNVSTTNRANNFSAGYVGWGCVSNLTIKMHYLDGDNNQQVIIKNIDMCDNIGWVDISEKNDIINKKDIPSKGGFKK